MLPCVFSVTDHRWCQNVLKTKKWHANCRGVHVTNVFTTFWRLLWSITEQTHGNMESVLFYTMMQKRKKTDTHTCLVILGCSRIWASLGIVSVPNATFHLCFFFFCYLILEYRFFEEFFVIFSCLKQNDGEIILQNSESLEAMTRNGNCRKDFFQFTHSQVVKNSFCLHFTFFFVVNNSC